MALTKNSQIDLNGNEMILDADGDTTITADTDDQIDFKTAGSDRVTVNSSGNVGIGTTSPEHALHVDSGTANTVAQFKSTDANAYIEFLDSDAGTSGCFIGGAGDDFVVLPNASEKFRVTSAGNVGIGTSSPDKVLTVADNGSNCSITLYKSPDGSLNSDQKVIAMGTGSSSNNSGTSGGTEHGILQMFHNGTEEIRLYTQGNSWVTNNFGIGTTTPNVKLNVKSSSDTTAAYISGGTYAFAIDRDQASGTNYAWYQGTTSSNTYVVYDGAGTGRFEVSLSSAGFISDRDQKENITDIPYGLDTVKKLKPKKFKFKDVIEMVETDGEKRTLEGNYNIGFIAQEMVEEVPEIVSGTDGQGDMKIDYAAFTSVLTKAIQEQQEQIEALQSEINTLKGG